MKCRGIISLLLSLALALCTFSGCGDSTPETTVEMQNQEADEENILDDELTRASEAGLLPEEWLSDFNQPVTVAEFNELLTKIVKMRDPALVEEWEKVAAQALQTKDTAQRDDVILSIFESAIVMGIDKVDFNHTADGWEGRIPDIDWWEGRSFDYDYFPNWNTNYNDSEYDIQAHSAWYVEKHISLVSEKYMIEPTEKWIFQFDLDVSREEAVRALVRYIEAIPAITYGESNYIAITDVTTYNKNIITDELLNKESSLPDVTQNLLPSEWKGAGIAARKPRANEYLPFEESDVRVLAENGFNFTRLFLGFSTLRYPDYTKDVRTINEKELEKLDQLLAWCMEYDIHLQISMIDYLDETGNAMQNMPRTDEEWLLVKDYWTAIANRYKGIPNKYLSFDLCNEIDPHGDDDFEYAKIEFSNVVDGIRNVDSQRVLLYSFSGWPNMQWVEYVGELNVAIGCHPYRPHRLCDDTYPDTDFVDSNLYWPRPLFYSWVPYGEELTITGEGLKGNLSIYTSRNGTIEVYADNTSIGIFELLPEGGEYPGDDYSINETIYIDIPAGTKEIVIKLSDMDIYFNAVGIKNDTFHTWLMCHDAYDIEEMGGTNLVIDKTGAWENAEGLMHDGEYVFEQFIKPMKDIADKNQVGFMVNEFGLFGVQIHWDIDMVVRFHDEYLKMLENHDIGWCYCELANKFPKHLVILTGGESQWEGATTEKITYTFDDGTSDTVVICKELMDTFLKYTKN